MTVTVADRIAVLKSVGYAERDARIQSLVRSVVEAENDKERRGDAYSELRANIATVHARDDIVLLVAHSYEQLRTADEQIRLLRHIRTSIIALCVLAVGSFLR
jgi:hypothetical protein